MVETIALLLAGVLTLSAAGKFAGVGAFRGSLMETYRMPPRVSSALAVLVPSTELAIAILMIWPTTARLGLFLALALFTTLLPIVVVAWRRGETGDCGCMGRLARQPLSGRTVARLITLAAAAGAALFLMFVPAMRIDSPSLPT